MKSSIISTAVNSSSEETAAAKAAGPSASGWDYTSTSGKRRKGIARRLLQVDPPAEPTRRLFVPSAQ